MENLLLLLDELDDLVTMVAALWRPVVGFLVAVAVFIATGLVFYSMPMMAEGLALALVIWGLVLTFREGRRAKSVRAD